ncbi:MAG: hypothetical protein ACJAWC_002184 [Yoonia sp.]|jgi:hypothetical protein
MRRTNFGLSHHLSAPPTTSEEMIAVETEYGPKVFVLSKGFGFVVKWRINRGQKP